MLKSYKVAEHVFQLEMPDSCPAWDMLAQYDPFAYASPDTVPIFKLRLADSLPDRDLVTVYDVPLGKGEPRVKLFRCGEDWRFETAPWAEAPTACLIDSDPSFNTASFCICDKKQALFGINNALMLMFAFRTAVLGTLELHASVTVCEDKAFLFMAKSGTGKSTHSSMWLKYIPGSHLLNDDNPIVRVWPDGRVVAYGSPWSGKTPCYKNECYPVGAFVRIRRCAENRIERLSLLESYALLYSSSSGFKADREMGDAIHRTLEKAVIACPSFVLDCRPDEEAALVCSEEVLKAARNG